MRDGLDIIEVRGRNVVDSQGFCAAEAEIILENGAHGKASVSLARELENREAEIGDCQNMISECMLLENASMQYQIDQQLWTCAEEKQTNVVKGMALACSIACARAAGAGMGIPVYQYLGGIVGRTLPVPMMNFMHGSRVEGYGIDVAELLFIPAGTATPAEQLRMGTEVYHTLKKLLELDGHNTAAGEDGSFSGAGLHLEEALELILDGGKLSGYKAGEDFSLGINMGAERIYDRDNSLYQFDGEGHLRGLHIERDIREMIGYYLRLIDGFPIKMLEGIMADEDEQGWMMIMKILGHRVTILGDSIFHSDGKRLMHGMGSHMAGGLVIKLQEAGTVSRALEVSELARQGGYQAVISHQGRETEDPFLADFAAAVGSRYLKAGAPCRGERTSKYNELIRLEEFFKGKSFSFPR